MWSFILRLFAGYGPLLDKILINQEIMMADLKATLEELKSLVPIVQEIAGDVDELDAKVKELQQNSDPQTIQEIADLTASLKTSLRAAADKVPEAAPPENPEGPASVRRRNR